MAKYKNSEQFKEESVEAMTRMFSEIIHQIGEDPNRNGLLKTPERAAKAVHYLTHGYELDPAKVLRSAMFEEEYSEMVIVKDIELFSLCEHHILPFFGKAHIAYISSGKIIGLSKLNRLVQYFSQRPQVQERLTMQIANELKTILETESVAIVIDAVHLCVSSRGVQDTKSSTVTTYYSGKFKQEDTKNEFLGLIR